MWSLLVGLIAAPYVALYGAVHVIAGAWPYARSHPGRAWMLAVALPLASVNLVLTTCGHDAGAGNATTCVPDLPHLPGPTQDAGRLSRDAHPLMRRLLYFAAACASVAAALICFVVWWQARPPFPDTQLVLDAGRRLEAGEPLYPGWFLYPPAAAVLGAALLPIPGVMWIAAGLRVAVVGGLAASLARTRRSRCAAALLAVASVPFAQEFFYGNESTWLTLGIALVAWRRDRFWTGMAIGVLAGFFAKPALLPFILWMLLWRPRALCGAALAGAAVTAVGLAAAGTAGYLAWLQRFRSVGLARSGVWRELQPGGPAGLAVGLGCRGRVRNRRAAHVAPRSLGFSSLDRDGPSNRPLSHALPTGAVARGTGSTRRRQSGTAADERSPTRLVGGGPTSVTPHSSRGAINGITDFSSRRIGRLCWRPGAPCGMSSSSRPRRPGVYPVGGDATIYALGVARLDWMTPILEPLVSR